MASDMRRTLLKTLLVVLMTSQVLTRRIDTRQAMMGLLTDRCLNYMELCVPGVTRCCNGMSCHNLSKGFCMVGYEPCVCQLRYSVDVS